MNYFIRIFGERTNREIFFFFVREDVEKYLCFDLFSIDGDVEMGMNIFGFEN